MIGFGDLNLKCPSILVILIFMSNLNFMLSSVEHEESLITLGCDVVQKVWIFRSKPVIKLTKQFSSYKLWHEKNCFLAHLSRRLSVCLSVCSHFRT